MWFQVMRLWLLVTGGLRLVGAEARRPLRGAVMVEYAVVVALIAVVALAAVQGLGQAVVHVFQSIVGHVGGVA